MSNTSLKNNNSKEVLPYFDILLAKFKQQDKTAEVAFKGHVHWGYWENPPIKDVSPADFHRAGELMVEKVIDIAKIKNGYRVLDVGCGLGGTIKLLNEEFSNCEFVGVNIDDRQIEIARENSVAKNGNSIEFIKADACALPFSGEKFDIIICVESIFHFKDRRIFFQECRRVLKADGRLIISDFVPIRKLSSVLNLFERGFNFVSRAYGEVNIDISISRYRKS